MMPVLFALPGNEEAGKRLAHAIGCEVGRIESRRFPDGESYLRLLSAVEGRDVMLVCTLHKPDEKLVQLYLAANIARELGARSVGLIAPYLAYMRQDSRFKPGEGQTSSHIARLISSCCDWLVTVDPHLHRHNSLSEIYSIPTRVVQSALSIATWIKANIPDPVIIGPDAESEQWAAKVAAAAGCQHAILQKTRYGDREVEVSMPDTAGWNGATPVVVDDIASSGKTMLAAVLHLRSTNLPAPVCIAVHGVFAGSACQELTEAGVARIVSCNTITHETNEIDVSDAIAVAAAEMLSRTALAA
ncbi:ribose-phosphate pyrophosphokinase [Herbaspirillum sp. GCM10030257]|uniref:ribose-phosphate pyrophosphokinase n=1 Tax=Herbaspirillum sp. GCM10030257 TaxID=3273393 RepID=UPI0036154F51